MAEENLTGICYAKEYLSKLHEKEKEKNNLLEKKEKDKPSIMDFIDKYY